MAVLCFMGLYVRVVTGARNNIKMSNSEEKFVNSKRLS